MSKTARAVVEHGTDACSKSARARLPSCDERAVCGREAVHSPCGVGHSLWRPDYNSALEVSVALDGRHTDASQRDGPDRYIKNYDFIYAPRNANFTVTAVKGHLFHHDFAEAYRKWQSSEPFDLFDAPIETMVKTDCKNIERNLLAEARKAQMLMIWTDCDREGENIGAEIVHVCRKSNRNIQVKRARFSAIIAQ